MDPQLIGTVVTGAVALLVGLITARAADRKDRTTTSQGLIDQLQEERNAAVDRAVAADTRHATELADLRTDHNSEMAGIREDMASTRRRQLALEDYVGQLRAHIDQRREPPAPPWPQELLTR